MLSNNGARRFKVGICLRMDGWTPTALPSPSSAVPRLFVRFDLHSRVEMIETNEQVDDSHQFDYSFIVQPQSPHRGGVD